jgi:two-component system response regulator
VTVDDPVEILMVEDNPNDVELAMHAFRKHNFANKVHVLRDGAEALDFLFARGAYAGRQGAELPRVVLLDLKLPLVDGIEVLRQVKGDPRTRHIPIVVLTTSHDDHDVNLCYSMGVNSYIVKPVDFVKFTEVVRQLGLYWYLLNRLPNTAP